MTRGGLDELVGSRADELYHDQPEVLASLRKAAAGERVHLASRIRLVSTGEWYEHESTFLPLDDDEGHFLVFPRFAGGVPGTPESQIRRAAAEIAEMLGVLNARLEATGAGETPPAVAEAYESVRSAALYLAELAERLQAPAERENAG